MNHTYSTYRSATNDLTQNEGHNFATTDNITAIAKEYGIGEDAPSVSIFLYTQTASINSLNTNNEFNNVV